MAQTSKPLSSRVVLIHCRLFWSCETKMSWTTSASDHGSVVTVSRIVDDRTVGVIAAAKGAHLRDQRQLCCHPAHLRHGPRASGRRRRGEGGAQARTRGL